MAQPRAREIGWRLSQRWLTVSVLAAIVVLLYVLINGGGWIYDDNLSLILEGQRGLTWDWLTAPIFQHWGIGYQFVYAVIHKLMPLDYRWALGGMLATLVAGAYLLQRIVTLLFGWGWRSVLIAGYFCLSIFFVRNLQWLASGLQAVPAAFWDLLCLYGYVRFQIEGSRRWVVLTAAALAGGLLFFERPLYMLLYLALFRILFLSDDLRPRAIVRTFFAERVMWGALLLVALVWAIGYHEAGAGQGLTSGTVSASQYLVFFRIVWAQTLIPGLLGVTVPAVGVSAIEIVVSVALQLVFVALVAYSIHRKRSAWRGWLFFIIPVLFSSVVVARTRVPMFGTMIGRDLRYLTDFAWIAPLGVAFAFSRRRTLTPHDGAGAPTLTLPRQFSWPAAAGVLALVVYGALAATTAAKLQRDWPGHAARRWESALRRGLSAAEGEGRHVVLADAEVPPFILGTAFTPLNRLATIVPLYAPGTQVDGVLDGPLMIAAPDGSVHRASVAADVAPSAIGQLLASHEVTVAGAGRVTRRAGSLCVTAGTSAAFLTRSVPPINNPLQVPFSLRATYTAGAAARLPVSVDAGHGYPTGSDRFLAVAARPASSLLFLDEATPRRIRIEVTPGDTVCVSRLQVVTLR